MAELVYLLCAVTSAFCALLLVRNYRKARTKLLMWSVACFAVLAVNNILLFFDLVVVPDLDLSALRSISALVAISLLVIGLTWEDA